MKRLLVIILLAFSLTSSLFGQTKQEVATTDTVAGTSALSRLKSLNNRLKKSEKMPEFPGGEQALMDFLRQKIVYPKTAARFGVQGRVVVAFVVKKDGSIGEIKIKKSVDKELDEEALRVVKMLPKFTPACIDGEPVAVWYTLPVTFKLPSVISSEDNSKW